MDDRGNTHRTLDALAELYLSGTLPGQSEPVAITPAPTIRLAPKPAATMMRQPPSPTRRAPGAAVSPDTHQPSIAPKATPAADTAPRRKTPEPLSAPAALQTVFLANLPGFGAPWLTQYANYTALKLGGPVALLRLDDELIEVQIIRPRTTGQPLAERTTIHGHTLAGLLPQLLDEPIDVRGFIVYVGSLTHATALDRARALPGSWTILCGADEAAIASAQQLLVQLVPAAESTGDKTENDSDLRPIGVMIFGSDEDRATAAVRHLRQDEQIATPVLEFRGWQKQMVPVDVQDVGTFEGRTLWREVQEFLVEFGLDHEAPASSATAGAVADDMDLDAEALAEELAANQSEPEATPKPTPMRIPPKSAAPVTAQRWSQRPRSTDHDEASLEQELAPARPAAVTPSTPAATPALQPVAASAPAAPAAETQLDLSRFLALPAGTALEARCPRQPQVQLVLDAAGRLHLLAHHTESLDLGSVVADLLEARAWVHEHLALLQLTQRDKPMDAQIEPTLHLFSADARSAVAAVNGLGHLLRIHLLHRAGSGESVAWIATALN